MSFRPQVRTFPFVIILLLLVQNHFSAAQCCQYKLFLQDSYGDGWNGGSLQVAVNGSSLGSFSGKNFLSLDTLPVCTGDTIRFQYTGGVYNEENTYQVFDAAWNLVFANGPNPQADTVFTFVAHCDAPLVPGTHPCNAIPIDTGQCLVLDNSGFLGSGIRAACSDYKGGDLWLKMTVPPSGNVSFQTSKGGLSDTVIAAWGDSTCSAIQFLGCDDDGGEGYYSLLTLFDLTPGKSIYLQVFGYGGGTGFFELCAKDNGTITLDSSELPIVLIRTLGQSIVPDTKINAQMEIKYNGPNSITYLSDPANEYNGAVGIEVRGASSAGYPQQPYGFETRTSDGNELDVSFLGMPLEHKWVLLSNYNDRSLVRNALAYRLFREMGNYASRTSLCEVVIDSVYKGIYLLGEKIKRDKNRVDIAKLTPADNEGDDLTGGYMLQQNYWDANNSFLSNYSPINHPDFDIHFVYEYPQPDSMTAAQKGYIASYIDSLETALYGTNFADTLTGYRKYLDVPSFIDYFLVNEVARNADGFKKSVFYNKNKASKGGKLRAGPVWDFDWAWKNITECALYAVTDGSGWAHERNECPTDVYSCEWYNRLMQDGTFNDQLRCQYEQYRSTILSTDYLFAYIDSVETLVQHAQERHFKRWPILGVSGPAPEIEPVAATYDAEMDFLKSWIAVRLNWLDANIPGVCAPVSVVSAGTNVANGLQVYPNPSDGHIHFEGNLTEAGTYAIQIFNVMGAKISQIPVQSGRVQLEHQIQQAGAYYFQLLRGTEVVQRGRLLVF